jgi:hypothetical protein
MSTYEAKIISVEIKNEDSINKIFLTVEGIYGHNIQPILYNPAGDFSVPLPDDYVTILELPGTGNYIAIGNLNTVDNIDKGEKYLYSRDENGNEKASIYLDKTGKLSITTTGAMEFVAGGDITFENDLGAFKLQNSDGQFSANSPNFTVDK